MCFAILLHRLVHDDQHFGQVQSRWHCRDPRGHDRHPNPYTVVVCPADEPSPPSAGTAAARLAVRGASSAQPLLLDAKTWYRTLSNKLVLGSQANLRESSKSKELAEMRLQVLVVVITSDACESKKEIMRLESVRQSKDCKHTIKS